MAYDIKLRERRNAQGEWERLVIGFKGHDQGPLVMIWTEYRRYKHASDVLWAVAHFSSSSFYYWKNLFLLPFKSRWQRLSKFSWQYEGKRWCLDIDFLSFSLGAGIEVKNGSCFLALPFFLLTRGAK